jgi:hypothetical protein
MSDLFHFMKEWLPVFQTSALQSIEYQFSISVMKKMFPHSDNIELVVFPLKNLPLRTNTDIRSPASL